MMPRSLLINRARARKQRIASNEFGELQVRRTKRGVKITALTMPSENRTGRRTGATYAVVDLDDAGVDRLIERLRAIRGGRRALP
jgi:hypothetical protein